MAPAVSIATDPVARAVDPLFGFEATKGGERVMLVAAVLESDGSVTVDTEVWPTKSKKILQPVLASYAFSTEAKARQFLDEAMIAFEYLGCTVLARFSHPID
jgi:hypothetical protein